MANMDPKLPQYLQVTTSTATKQQAEQIARALVDERLAACVQVSGPIRSIYRWQGSVEQADEWLCMAKTRQTLFAAVESTIRQLHLYECPEIIAVPIADGSASYLEWLKAQLVEETD